MGEGVVVCMPAGRPRRARLFWLSARHFWQCLFTERGRRRNWQQQLSLQEIELDELKQESQRELEALSLRLAMMQARLVRLDAMGERITRMSDFDNGEFDLANPLFQSEDRPAEAVSSVSPGSSTPSTDSKDNYKIGRVSPDSGRFTR